MKKTQIVLEPILVGGTYVTNTLDVNTDISFGVTYQIDDIRNPEKRNNSHSKTIVLPGTKNNNKLLGNLFDVNSDFTFFNPNIRIGAKIVVDYVTILEGYLQLLSIDKDCSTDAEGNSIQYNVVIFNDNVNIIKEIGEKYY